MSLLQHKIELCASLHCYHISIKLLLNCIDVSITYIIMKHISLQITEVERRMHGHGVRGNLSIIMSCLYPWRRPYHMALLPPCGKTNSTVQEIVTLFS